MKTQSKSSKLIKPIEPVVPIASIAPIEPAQPTEGLLAQANAANLAYTEQVLSDAALLVYGVPLALPFSYELIQIVNHAYLASLLGESKSDGDTNV